MIKFKENAPTDGRMDGRTDGKMDGRTDRPYFIGAFLLPVGVQQEENGSINQKSKKVQKIILNCFTKQGKKLSNCVFILLQLNLRLNMKQNMEKDQTF